MRPTVTGIVLAGGRASRFGGPKLGARIGGASLLTLAARAVAEVADDVRIAGPAVGALPGVGDVRVTIVQDETPFEGPLVAVANALRNAPGALAIVVGGDMPRLVPAVLRAMLERLATDDAVDIVTLERPAGDPMAPDGPTRTATLPLALRVAPMIAVIERAIEAGDRSLVRLLGRVRWVELPRRDWLALDPGGQTLLDVDRPADLEHVARTDFR